MTQCHKGVQSTRRTQSAGRRGLRGKSHQVMPRPSERKPTFRYTGSPSPVAFNVTLVQLSTRARARAATANASPYTRRREWRDAHVVDAPGFPVDVEHDVTDDVCSIPHSWKGDP